MKTIYILTVSLAKGGAENQLMKLAVFLSNLDHTVKIISGKKENDFSEELESNDIENIYFNYKTLKGFSLLRKYIKHNRPDIMLSFMFGPNIIGRFLKLKLKIPLITSVRCNDISAFYLILYRLTYKVDTFSTFNSEYALKKFVKEGISVKEKSILVNNAISISQHKEVLKKKPIFNLVSIAHFRPSKDYKTLFEAIQIIKNKGLDIQLMVLGHTFNSDWPFSIINELNISDNVEIIGFVSNTQEYLLKADALVLSSFREGTPNAILEGMAHKLPIISSNIPGCDSLVKNAHCGFLFEKQNPEQLAEKIIEMMQLSREERKTMGESGYKYVYENYREEVVYEKWMALIEKAINQAA